jgi:long-chain acyl-CoA synthetase
MGPDGGGRAMNDALAERERIEAQIAGQTLCGLMARNASQHGSKPALHWKAGDEWRQLTWGEYADQVADASMGLRSLGVGKGDFVAIQSTNRPEHVIADAAAFHAGCTPVSLYNTLSPDQIHYIAEHCEAKVAVVENRDFMKRWEEIRSRLPNLEHIVMLEDAEDFGHVGNVVSWESLLERGHHERAEDPGAFDATWRQVQPEDIATVIYTSGTTGPPKGVVLTHHNVMYALAATDSMGVIVESPTAVSYLPLAHIAERMFSHYLALHFVAEAYYCPDPTQLLDYVQEARPSAFLAVPRVWEKIHAGLLAKINAEEDERKRKIALAALDVGRQVARRQRRGAPIPLRLRAKHALFDRLVFAKIRHGVGMDRCELAASAAAPISEDVLEFFLSIGVPIYEVYGLSETTGGTNFNRPGAMKIGTVGQPLPGQEVRLADDGEVLIRGPNVMPGYYKNEEATRGAIDEEGWLHTGDLGSIDREGYLRIVGRKKEIIITAGGKNIAPNNIEGLLKEHPLVGQAAVIGDRRPFVSTLIVIDHEAAPVWAQQQGIEFTDLEAFARDERVEAEIQRAVDAANQKLSQVEQVKKFTILPTEWTAESEELTPTLKLKRRVIEEKYADEIEALYGQPRS